MGQPFDVRIEEAIDTTAEANVRHPHCGRTATTIHHAQTLGLPPTSATFQTNLDQSISFFFERLCNAMQVVVIRQMPDLEDLGVEELQYAIRSLFQDQDLGLLIYEVFAIISRSDESIHNVYTTVDDAINTAWSDFPDSNISTICDAIVDGRTQHIDGAGNTMLSAANAMIDALHLGFRYELNRLVQADGWDPITPEQVIMAANMYRDQKIDQFLLEVIEVAMN